MTLAPKTVNRYHIFLASPGDVSEERQHVRRFFEYYNRTTAHVWNVEFVVVDWENYTTTGVGRPQELITRQTLEKVRGSLALVIGIMGQRFGSPSGKAESGTEEEFNWAMASHLDSGFPEIKWFFRKENILGLTADPAHHRSALEQWEKVLAFRNRMRDLSNPLFYAEYPNPASFAEVFARDLSQWLVDSARPWAALQPIQALHSEQSTQQRKRRSFSPQELQSWVDRHHPGLSAAFLGLASVQARQVHVPLDVCLLPAGAQAMEGPRLLTPEDLAPLLEAGGDHVVLLSGDGGAGKTSLAFAIARWLLAGEPGGVVRLPVLLETALAPGETVAGRVRSWLRAQLAEAGEEELAEELVKALLAAKRLIPMVDHLSELTPAAREQLLGALPPGLVIVTSRSDEEGFPERPMSRIVPQRIAVERLQAFFLDYLRRKRQGEALNDDDLMPAQAQLKRIVGDKPITVLLAQMFIEDVIANREEGLLAGSVPELMLSYVRRLDTPDKPEQRQRAGLVISPELVQRAMRVVALRSHRQGAEGKPLFQPLEFSEALARQALMAQEPEGMALTGEEAKAVLGYLIELRLLLRPGVAVGRLRFPLDPLADHLAAAEQFERLDEQAQEQRAVVWGDFLTALEPRPVAERERMRGFLLALRDGAMEAARGDRALAMPADVPDRLAALGFLDAEGERYRLALQRARKWMWELGVPVASERRDAIGKLAAMAAAPEGSERRAARDVASRRLARVLAERIPEGQANRRQEQEEAALVLGLIGSREAVEALELLATQAIQPVPLRRMALEALGLVGLKGSEHRRRVEDFLERQLRADALDLLVEGEEGWAEHDRRLPLLQGASRGLQLAASAELPLLGSAPPKRVPMLTLTALKEGEGLRIRTEVVTPAVWKLPLPQWPGEAAQQLELVVVPGDDYEIGSPEEEDGRNVYTQFRQKCEQVNVEAQRKVSMKPYALVRHPLSQAQWRTVAALPRLDQDLSLTPGTYDANGLWERHGQPGGLAVESVSWSDCQEWLKRLNLWLKEQWPELDGEGDAPLLSLPSESQWEAACRAGSCLPFHFGDTLDSSWANHDGRQNYGSGRKGCFRQRPVTTGVFGLVNRWGLADMHGQLREWCVDKWHRDPLQGYLDIRGTIEASDQELSGNQEQDYRLLRGGSWIGDPRYCRAAFRNCAHPERINSTVGFRPGCFRLQV
jgi:formylglycine-generating enzyme required for sulfatase activity